MSRKVSIILVLAVLVAFLGYAAWKVLLAPSDLPPEGFARGNGRIEADLVDISTRLAGRVAQITVREGDLVRAGDVLAVMDTTELVAQRMRAQAHRVRRWQKRCETSPSRARQSSCNRAPPLQARRVIGVLGHSWPWQGPFLPRWPGPTPPMQPRARPQTAPGDWQSADTLRWAPHPHAA